jgi:L-galactose dehydrogenase
MARTDGEAQPEEVHDESRVEASQVAQKRMIAGSRASLASFSSRVSTDSAMEYRDLGTTGMKVSALSFGASSLGAVFHDINESDAVRTVHVAVDHGVNFIDVSPYYGATKAETVLGRALKQISRDRYYLATKVGQYGEGEFDFSAARITRGVDESLARLNLDYVDLIQCHDIEFVNLDQIVNETLPALHKLKSTGKVRHVGITGLPLKIFREVIDCVSPGMVETILSFCHYELNDISLASLVPYLKERRIGIINASPTGMGLLTERGTPAWHPASEAIKAGCRRAVEFCKQRGINIVELAIQFSISHPDLATTLVGTANSQNMLDNIRYAQTPIDPAKLAQVLEVLKPIHNFNFTRGLEENRDPIVS